MEQLESSPQPPLTHLLSGEITIPARFLVRMLTHKNSALIPGYIQGSRSQLCWFYLRSDSGV